METSDLDRVLRQNFGFAAEQRRRADVLHSGAVRDIVAESLKLGYTPAHSRIIYSDVIGEPETFAEFCRVYAQECDNTTVLQDVFFTSAVSGAPQLTIPDMPPIRRAADVLADSGFVFDLSYSDSFSDAAYEVQVGSADFTILPTEQNGERLFAFDSMRKRGGLKINVVVSDSEVLAKYSLVSGAFSDISKLSAFTRLAFTAECRSTPYELLCGAAILGALPTSANISAHTIGAELDVSKINSTEPLAALVMYLAASAETTFDGIYSEYK